MRNNNISFTSLAAVILVLPLLGVCSDISRASIKAPESQAVSMQQQGDVVASVGEEEINFSLLNTMLNSSAMVGLSIPALGTPERQQVIITLLDKAISANLLYLDAVAKGVDRQPVYLQDIKRFEDAVLASLYREKILYGDLQVSNDEIDAFNKHTAGADDELTGDQRMAIEARLRNDKLNTLKTRLRGRIRAGVTVVIEPDALQADRDGARTDETVVAKVGDDAITWGEVRELLQGADKRAASAEFYLDSDTERRKRLDVYIDNLVMANKGRAAGLASDPSYLERTGEYRKTHLINLHREKLVHDWLPSDEELKIFFEANKQRITVPEMRKVQMVVLKSREEALDIKQKIESGEMTIYQAARDYSIDPNAKQTLGEMGWVMHGSGFPELDEFTFFQEPDVLGGPVESPAGWHLVKVLDVQDAQMQYLESPQTHRMTLRLYINEKLNNYVIGLRKNSFKVAVYDDELERQFAREAEFMAEMTARASREGSITSQRKADMEKWMAPSASE